MFVHIKQLTNLYLAFYWIYMQIKWFKYYPPHGLTSMDWCTSMQTDLKWKCIYLDLIWLETYGLCNYKAPKVWVCNIPILVQLKSELINTFLIYKACKIYDF